MALPPSTVKQSSRWNFLQQAVAGVESRLDTILADADTLTDKNYSGGESGPGQPTRNEPPKNLTSAKIQAHSPSHSQPTSKSNEPLQERLAKTLVSRKSIKSTGDSAASSRTPSRTSSPVPSNFRLRSDDVEVGDVKGASLVGQRSPRLEVLENLIPQKPSAPNQVQPQQDSIDSPSFVATSSQESPSSRKVSGANHDVPSIKLYEDSVRDTENNPMSSKHYQEVISQTQSNYEASELRRREETHIYLERIDSLQSKLSYLVGEATKSAKNLSSGATAGSLEQKIAARDEKIAILMDEGQKLSMNEIKHLNMVKNLRAKVAESEKRLADANARAESNRQEARETLEKMKRAEDAERRTAEKSRTFAGAEKELEAVRSEYGQKQAIIENLEAQLIAATAALESLQSQASIGAIEREKEIKTVLAADLSNLKVEKELSDDRYRAEIRELREKAEKEKELSRSTQLEMRKEFALLENRMEEMRARAEEASSGTVNGTQAKLLRQVETLQSQHTIANENWRGIEGSFTARVAGLEQEKAELGQRELEGRRKIREMSLKLRKAEEDLSNTSTRVRTMESEVSQHKAWLEGMRGELSKSKAELEKLHKELVVEKANLKTCLSQSLEAEKDRVQQESDEVSDTVSRQTRENSPTVVPRRGLNMERISSHGRPNHPQTCLADTAMVGLWRSKNEHAQRPQLPHSESSIRQGSTPSGSRSYLSHELPQTPFIQADLFEDLSDTIGTPISPDRTMNDMISASTVAAGPSVQLVERMSATIRRLESEKAMFQDELGRLSTQRGEAREQIVFLMREAEEKRAAEDRSRSFEAEVAQINKRYQTTLEMLGEKSELVEELQADIADVKKIYRDLVDSTMR